MREIAIYAPEVLHVAAELTKQESNAEYQRGVTEVVAALLYPEMEQEHAKQQANSRIREYMNME